MACTTLNFTSAYRVCVFLISFQRMCDLTVRLLVVTQWLLAIKSHLNSNTGDNEWLTPQTMCVIAKWLNAPNQTFKNKQSVSDSEFFFLYTESNGLLDYLEWYPVILGSRGNFPYKKREIHLQKAVGLLVEF